MTQTDDALIARLFELSPFPTVVSRLHDHTVLAINERAAQLIGIPQSEASGLAVTDYYVDPSERIQLVDRLRVERRVDNLRLQIKRVDAEPLWVLASFRLVSWRGEPAVLAVFHDISGQLEAEGSLKSSERRLAAQQQRHRHGAVAAVQPLAHLGEAYTRAYGTRPHGFQGQLRAAQADVDLAGDLAT